MHPNSVITFDYTAVAIAIPVAVADNSCLNKCAVARHRYGAHIVVAQMEVPLQAAQLNFSMSPDQCWHS